MLLSEETWPAVAGKVALPSRDLVLELAVALAQRVPGHIVEFGVASGGSTRTIRQALTRHQLRQRGGERKRIYACDSFEGLSEQYENAAPGTFAQRPPKIPGVQIVVGYFDDSLTPALADQVGHVALASLDADLYSSTLTALRWLTPMLGSGSLLLFDEYLGENASECRAHEDWCAETGIETVTIAEFAREPSGWGTVPDRRVLAQVIGPEPLTKTLRYWPTPRRAANLARRGYRKLRGAR